MVLKINAPQFGEDATEFELVEWFVSVGDEITVGTKIAEILVGKAAVDFESETNGIVKELLQPEGAVVQPGDPLLSIETDDE